MQGIALFDSLFMNSIQCETIPTMDRSDRNDPSDESLRNAATSAVEQNEAPKSIVIARPHIELSVAFFCTPLVPHTPSSA